MFHFGHSRLFEQIKKMLPNVYLIVGVCSDQDIKANKGNVVMTEDERKESVRHCKWVDEVFFPAPWSPTLKFINKKKIDFIAHDTIPYPTPDYNDCYLEFKKEGKFLPTLRTEGISTSDILTRILKDRDNYYKKNLKKGISREEMNLSYLEYFFIQSKSVIDVVQKCLKEKE